MNTPDPQPAGASRPRKVRLFVKPHCGWCRQAREWLEEQGIGYEMLDVIADQPAREEMVRLSGQSLAPVIDVEGEVLADFDAADLAAWWPKASRVASARERIQG